MHWILGYTVEDPGIEIEDNETTHIEVFFFQYLRMKELISDIIYLVFCPLGKMD